MKHSTRSTCVRRDWYEASLRSDCLRSKGCRKHKRPQSPDVLGHGSWVIGHGHSHGNTKRSKLDRQSRRELNEY